MPLTGTAYTEPGLIDPGAAKNRLPDLRKRSVAPHTAFDDGFGRQNESFSRRMDIGRKPIAQKQTCASTNKDGAGQHGAEEKNGVPFVTFISTFPADSHGLLSHCESKSYASIPFKLQSGSTSFAAGGPGVRVGPIPFKFSPQLDHNLT